MGEWVRRTAITRLSVEDEQRELLGQAISEYKCGFQITTDLARERCNEKRKVQALAYGPVREDTALSAQHAILATRQAAEAITGCIPRRSTGKKVSKPTFTTPTVTYDTGSMTPFDDDTASLATTDDRVRCPLVLPDDDGCQRQYLDSGEWHVTESTLTARDGEYFLHLGFRRHPTETERDTAEDGTVLGVALGIENLAVTSTAHFVSGRELTHDPREFETVRAGLQQTGTRSAHRTLVRSSGRALRYIRDVSHQASNAIVEEALRYDCAVIAFENLTHIRARTRASWGHRWAFRTLYEQVECKPESVGVAVKQVPPRNTSKRCAERGFTADENRPTRPELCCRESGAQANADYNAAKNIGLGYVRRDHQSSRRTGDSQLALNSGTATPKGGFTAHTDGFEATFTDTPRPRTRAQRASGRGSRPGCRSSPRSTGSTGDHRPGRGSPPDPIAFSTPRR